MDDRTLLELAAKACGYWNAEFNCWSGAPSLGWNPLLDDGDALRLAVKLNLDLYQGEDEGPAAYAGYYMRGEQRQRFMTVQHGDDPYAATRRAIVRAAAAIGGTRK